IGMKVCFGWLDQTMTPNRKDDMAAAEDMATAGEAMEAVAREGGPEAAGLLADLMAQSRRELESVERSLMRGVELERDEWKERALMAEAKLYRIEERLWMLLK